MTENFDIAVVGYGPVGMTTAALLGRAGYKVVVLERYAGLYNLPRAAIFDDETMRTFAKLGISDELLPKLHVQESYDWQNGSGETLIQHAFDRVGRSGWAEWYMMYQPDLEDALDRTCRRSGTVEVRFDHPVTGYEQDADGVTVQTELGSIRADYVVACDGGNSFTRKALGIGTTDLGFSEPWMVCDFTLTGQPDLPMARQVCDPAQPISIISLGPTHHRFSFMLDSEADFAAESAPDQVWRRVAKYLHPADAELIRVATYTFRSILSDTWRHGRILLAGDAAHQMPPFLGQGMCSGIRDAQNLAFKLDLVLSGRAGNELLDSYQPEREPHVEAVIRKGMELGRVQTTRDVEAATERDRLYLENRRLRKTPEKIRFPGIGPGLHTDSPASGALFPQGVIEVGGRRGLFDEVLGYGWAILERDERGEIRAGVGRFPEALGPRDLLVDADGVYTAWFSQNDVKAVVVRPDFYVYATATVSSSAAIVLDELHTDLAKKGDSAVLDSAQR
ncbi:bifunctional 3-(3-hydroxy-phenyl)propionate/3-hydroxycinnamic acid hydroxylase [uncultured Microbacterium sp.]|uniref:bifunctional 3-(3-hydroxy-phenyl)propionate/3-hydroxycinnamic acid hydroxylase MhpA n=1 Tax=uncultured Microbacterium sp. TaxID=191216 RepID=UPI0035CC65DB